MIVADFGEEKTGKSSLALSFPDPIWYADFDLGYDRAKKPDPMPQITVEEFALPIEFMPSVRGQVNKITGVREVWMKFLERYIKALQDKTVETIVLDTGTQLQAMCRRAYLQELQEAQPPTAKLREKLQQIEYGEPNARMRAIYYAAKSFKKNLVVTHYITDVYATRIGKDGEIESYTTGKKCLEGFKDTPNLADMVILTYTEKPKGESTYRTFGEIVTCGISGIGLDMVGTKLQEPTYQKLIDLQQALKGE